jgi:hypothetical protein
MAFNFSERIEDASYFLLESPVEVTIWVELELGMLTSTSLLSRDTLASSTTGEIWLTSSPATELISLYCPSSTLMDSSTAFSDS